MFKCSDFSNHSKLIEKPHLNQLSRSSSNHDNSAHRFKPSKKAANWNSENLFGLFANGNSIVPSDSGSSFVAEWPQEQPTESDNNSNKFQTLQEIHRTFEEITAQKIPPVQVIHNRMVPSWCFSDEVPLVYKQIFDASTLNEMKQINTELLYPILLLSNVGKNKLAQIWSMVNRETPGQLVKHELYMALALIALAQNNVEVNNLDALFHLNETPVPKFDYHEAFAVKEPVSAEVAESQKEPIIRNIESQNIPDLIKAEENWANFSNFEPVSAINAQSQTQMTVIGMNDFNFSIGASRFPCFSNSMLPSDNASLKLKVPKSSSSDQVSLLSLDFKKSRY